MQIEALSRYGVVRDALAMDAIDGVRPRAIIEPESAEALAELLALCSRERMSIVLRGSGTKLGWGRRPAAIDLVVSTRRLNHVLAHAHDDLTATVEAGATVGDLNRVLAEHHQWLPLDTAFEAATVGGTIATNESGPLRHRHGTPRDLLIGIRFATADGLLVKAGGNVVKNVAGYDLGKLMSGSFGSLAAIVSATFKLTPLPSASTTLVGAFGNSQAIAQAVSAISASQLEPAAFDVGAHVSVASDPGASVVTGLSRTEYQLLIQFATTAAAVDAQIAETRRLLPADHVDVLRGVAETDAWRDHARRLWTAPGAVVKVSWLPAALEAVLALVERIRGDKGTSIELVGRAGVGAGLIRIEGDTATQVKAIEDLRAKPDVIGHVVVLRADRGVKEKADVWGPAGDTAALLCGVKAALDPAGILNAARGPV